MISLALKFFNRIVDGVRYCFLDNSSKVCDYISIITDSALVEKLFSLTEIYIGDHIFKNDPNDKTKELIRLLMQLLEKFCN